MEIVPFADEHLDAAAELLAERHRGHREVEPLLPPRYEDPAESRAEIEAAWREPDATGVVALSGEGLTGYLIGAPRAPVWGPNVWIGYAGHAVVEPETVRDLYAAAAAGWVERDRTAHYALVPAFDPAVVDAWFRLAFGQQHVHAIRETPPCRGDGAQRRGDGEAGDRDGEARRSQADDRDGRDGPGLARPGRSRSPQQPVDFEVRAATLDDLDGLLAIDHILPEHLMRAPVFSRTEPDPPEVARKEWVDMLRDERTGTFVAWRADRIVGVVHGVPAEYSSANASLARPDGVGMLAFIATEESVRGAGAGLALTNACYAWAREQGYDTLITDWRAANLPSSRFFGRGRGFRPTYLRLHRLVGY